MQDEEAFIKLIKQNEGIIFKITRIYTDNRENQKDLYQDIVYQLWKGIQAFRGDSKASTWMYRIALNTALLYMKRKKKRVHGVSLEGVVLKQEAYDPLMEERLEILYAKIKPLGDMDKGIIFLFLEGKKQEEIADITGLSTSNVGTRMARIKEKLRKSIVKT